MLKPVKLWRFRLEMNMRELSAFDQKEVRRMVARHIMIRAGFLREGQQLALPRINRELYETAYDLAHELGKVCIRE